MALSALDWRAIGSKVRLRTLHARSARALRRVLVSPRESSVSCVFLVLCSSSCSPMVLLFLPSQLALLTHSSLSGLWCLCIHIYTHVHIYTCVQVCAYACAYVHAWIHLPVHLHTFITEVTFCRARNEQSQPRGKTYAGVAYTMWAVRQLNLLQSPNSASPPRAGNTGCGRQCVGWCQDFSLKVLAAPHFHLAPPSPPRSLLHISCFSNLWWVLLS